MPIVIDTNHIHDKKPICFTPESNKDEFRRLSIVNPCTSVKDPPNRTKYAENIMRRDLHKVCIQERGNKHFHKCIDSAKEGDIEGSYTIVKSIVGDNPKLKNRFQVFKEGAEADSTYLRLAEEKDTVLLTGDNELYAECESVRKGKCKLSPPLNHPYYK